MHEKCIGYVSASHIMNLIDSGHSYFSYNGNNISLDNLKFQVFKTKGIKCAYCKIKGTIFLIFNYKGGYYLNLYTNNGVLITKDHIVPKARGGKTDINNLQTLCIRCNMKKSDK